MRMDGDDLMHPSRIQMFLQAEKPSDAVFIAQPYQTLANGRSQATIFPSSNSHNKVNLLFGVAAILLSQSI